MSRLLSFDAWLGLRVFHPPIIWICQRAGITQWAVYRFAWWIAALMFIWHDDHRSVIMSVWLVSFALLRTLSAGLTLNRPVSGSLPLRMIFLALLMLAVLLCCALGRANLSLFDTILVLFAEYATTIVTIPPKPKSQHTTAQKAAIA